MKTFLLSSALVAATAGVASAEITLSGDARMGISNGFVFGAGNDDTVFNSRARVTFTMTGSTDGGLEFGASFRADNAGGAASGTAGSVYVSGAFGKLSMGDVDGAAAAAVGHVDGVGYTGIGDLNENLFLANGGIAFPAWAPLDPNVVTTSDPSVLYEYSTGALSLYASITQLGYQFDLVPGDAWEGQAYSVAAAYTVDAYKFSIGYENVTVDNILPVIGVDHVTMAQWIIGADATFGQVTVKARYGKGDIENGSPYADFDQYALSGTYTADALSVTAFVSHKNWDFASGANLREVDAMGLGASYDLGGGAAIKGGVVKQEILAGVGPAVKDTAFDLGLTFSF